MFKGYRMKKIGLYAAAVAAAFAFSTSANAAQYLTISGPSGTFGDDNVSGEFTRTFSFGPQAGYQLASIDVSSIATSIGASNDLNFTSVTFNGVEFNTVLTGVQEFRNLLNQNLINGENTIVVTGVAQSNAAFAGTISLAPIPEPAAWAMMIAGFGLVGTATRRRARVSVAYA